MSLGGYDPVREARFQATMDLEIRYLKEQIGLLWHHNGKRRAETAQIEENLSAQIEAIRKRINGAVLWFAVGAGGLVIAVVRAKLGL